MKPMEERSNDNAKPIFFLRKSNRYSSLPASLCKVRNQKSLDINNDYQISNNDCRKANFKNGIVNKGALSDVSSKDSNSLKSCKIPYSELEESVDNLTSTNIISMLNCDSNEGAANYANSDASLDFEYNNRSLGTSENTHIEELSILNELDAILDIHDTVLPNTSTYNYEEQLGNCLSDLDSYLEELDKSLSPILNIVESEKLKDCNFPFNGLISKRTTLPKISKRNNAMKLRYPEKSISVNILQDISVANFNNLSSTSSHICFNDSTRDHKAEMIADMPNTKNTNDNLRMLGADTPVLPSSYQILTEDQIINNFLHMETRVFNEDRPRQYGRRAIDPSQRRILSNNSFGSIIANEDREHAQLQEPFNALVNITNLMDNTHSSIERHTSNAVSEVSSLRSSCMTSPVTTSLTSDSYSSENNESQTNNGEHSDLPIPPVSNSINSNQCYKNSFNRVWPYSCSRSLALLSCTLGLFNISRFSVLTINYGGNFLLQFLLLSLIFGIPLFWLQMCLGAKIKKGPVAMWKISPICTGIGVALILVQFILAIYSTVCIAWVLVYLRDSFPGKSNVYRWEDTISPYKHDSQAMSNVTLNIADYFNVYVLKRFQVANGIEVNGIKFTVNDRLAFYLAFIWSTVFIIICKGLKSYGKCLFFLGTAPLLLFFTTMCKFLSVVNSRALLDIFGKKELDDFFINTHSWGAAAQETFLTWGLMGASVIVLTSKHHERNGPTTLRKEAIIVVLLTFVMLTIASIFGLCCKSLLKESDYVYIPGSFEKKTSYAAVYSYQPSNIPMQLASFPTKWLPHYSSFMGDTYRRPGSLTHNESGYQALRLISELFPAVVVLAKDKISWVWTAITLASMFILGLAQLCIMWKPVSNSLGNSTSSVLFSCVAGLLLSIPFATEVGVSILYYIDFLVGGSWILPVLWTAVIFGVFLIRGRPYNGDDLVDDLHMFSSLSGFLALSWNVLLPFGLIALSTIGYKISLSSQFYYWRGKAYFSYWSRKLGSLIQIGVLLIVPIVALIQIYRYLTNGPPDILDRIQNLYRPREGECFACGISSRPLTERHVNQPRRTINNEIIERDPNDEPPKYTPPPSYTTATGARLAKLLRHSIRRSVRRFLGDPNRTTLRSGSEITRYSPSINLETTINEHNQSSIIEDFNICTTPLNNISDRFFSLGRKNIRHKKFRLQDHRRPASATPSLMIRGLQSTPFATDNVVHSIRSPNQNSITEIRDTLALNAINNNSFRSVENLILYAEPLGNCSAIIHENINGNSVNESNEITDNNGEPLVNNISVI